MSVTPKVIECPGKALYCGLNTLKMCDFIHTLDIWEARVSQLVCSILLKGAILGNGPIVYNKREKGATCWPGHPALR